MQELRFTVEPYDNDRLANMCGQFDSNIRMIEERLDVKIHYRGSNFSVAGAESVVDAARTVILKLYADAGEAVSPDMIHLCLQECGSRDVDFLCDDDVVRARKVSIKPRGKNQRSYIKNIRENDVNFGIGPAGTGKTYLGVGCAVEALEMDRVQRLVLVRPAVEAGEKLGFLPGDLSQKVDPYLRPIYDALYDMLGFDRVGKLIAKNIIEIAPLAYMRGRTLNNAFVILDEAQNTTRQQMKMFLTRIGFGSTAVITGDITQVDLPGRERNGLEDAVKLLKGIEGISFTNFSSKDVVRHPLVQKIIEAYE